MTFSENSYTQTCHKVPVLVLVLTDIVDQARGFGHFSRRHVRMLLPSISFRD